MSVHLAVCCALILLLSFRDITATSCKTCQSPPSDVLPLCRCDDQCAVFGDCCPDAVYNNSTVISDSIKAVLSYMECQPRYRNRRPLRVRDAYYMVSSCPPHSNWTQDEQYATSIANNCTSPDFLEFPPVSDPSSGITYRNVFCAICHNVDTSASLTWPSRLECDHKFIQISQSQNITLDLMRQYCPRCSFNPPINSSVVMDTLRWCFPIVESTCPLFTQSSGYNETEYEQIVDSCVNGDYNPILGISEYFNPHKLYRNSNCSTCNAASHTYLQCGYYPKGEHIVRSCKDAPDGHAYAIGPAPFSVLLDVTGSGVVGIMSSQIDEVEFMKCTENQVFDPIQGCRDIVCPNGLTPIAGTCVLEPSTVNFDTILPIRNETNQTNMATYTPIEATYVNQTASNTTLNTTDTVDDMNTTISPLTSTSVVVNCAPIALDDDEYTITGDDNASVIFRGEVLDIVGYDSIGRPLVCVRFSNSGNITVTRNSTITHLLYPPGLAEISYASVLLSIIASSLILITYSIFSEFRTLPSKLLMNMAVAFLIGDIILLISNVTSLYLHLMDLCVTISILLHCFFLARFSWMNCMGVEYMRTFYKAFRLSDVAVRTNAMSQNKQHDLMLYMMVGWGVPLAITFVTIVVNFTVEGSVRYGTDTYGEQGLCWINNRNAIIIAFIIPVFLATVLNLIAFVVVVSLLCRASQNITIKELRKSQQMPHIRVALGVFLVLGLAWVFGFISLLSNQSWAWYPFIILNANQAVFIAICFLFTRKVVRKYLTLFNKVNCKSPSVLTRHSDKLNQVPITVISGAASDSTVMKSTNIDE